jgi:hypothetical protein
MAPALPIHPHLTHPLTGQPLQAVFVSEKTGRIFWPVIGAAEDGGDGSDGGEGYQGHADVSLDELKAQLADLGLTPGQLKGRLAASRKWEDRAKEKDPEFQSAKEKAAQYDALLASTQTDQERAVIEARQEAKAAALQEAAPRIVRAEFRAAAKGVLGAEQLEAFLEDYSPTNYLTDSGDVDEQKVTAKVAKLAGSGNQQAHVTLGQGRKVTDVKPSVSAGREMYEASRKKRSA